ncbi:MAG: NAD-dependent deacetylase [SAR324 cluster bacterium]|nr:NAD-dependent deacetylase [SAR324 cluster bacterium]
MNTDIEQSIHEASEAISNADAILIGAGAGMGVDSGLPDFRGKEGFWRAYPVFKKLGYSFEEMANPAWFEHDPQLAWGFYGHRLNLYRATEPHMGYTMLKNWGEQKSGGVFVFTSNVDGQFQKAGFPDSNVYECHGSIHHLQCSGPCCNAIWSSMDANLDVDETTLMASSALPRCPTCWKLARPNILMFGDWHWNSDRASEQQNQYSAWLEKLSRKSLVVIEFGAGKSVPTVRHHCESTVRALQGTLIRINPRESEGPPGTISLPMGALETLEQIQNNLSL